VSSFRLDKYIVTVGRFRQFVAAWNNGAGYTPPAGSGRHTHLNGGLGLAAGPTVDARATFEPGWAASNDINLAPTNANLAVYSDCTWTASPGSNENLPIDCVNWYEAYAFCIWDGGFLPSDAEWEYAAAGGSDQREYPWGSTAPGPASEYAVYGTWPNGDSCYYPTGVLTPCAGSTTNMARVGTATLGAGRWGQLDLAGEINEWAFDWYTNNYADPCVDCAQLSAGSTRVIKGGNWNDDTSSLLPTNRAGNNPPTERNDYIGFRCARSP
jgi:formylglycine-generating enzyme required for sulfatase activity